MHPALSVVFFTSVSGAGYGLLFLLGVGLLVAPESFERAEIVVLALAGGLLATLGLLSSLLHLGQPQRAWRALSQWRSSWLSREGVAALIGYLPLAALLVAGWTGASPILLRVIGAALAFAAAVTVYCTARIYTSLQPVPAWRDPRVLPGYIGFALLSGLLWGALLRALLGLPVSIPVVAAVAAGALAMLWLKATYWRAIDSAPVPVTLASATGLQGAQGMRPLESPHTEANYLLREMGFVLARRHSARLRRAVPVLLVFAVGTVVIAGLVGQLASLPLLLLALLAAQLGIFVERWLFFAEARHLVTVYYRG